MAACWRTSWYRRLSRSTPLPSSSTSTPCERPGAWPSRSTRKRIAGREHEMRVPGSETERDATAGLLERDTFRLECPRTREGPQVQRQPLGELVGAVMVEPRAVE